MKPNSLRHKLIDRQPCRGLWLQLPCAPLVRLLAQLPADWLCIDAEHGPTDRETLHAMVTAAQCPVLVRVAAQDRVQISGALDTGAVGVIVPMVNSKAQAEAAVAAAKYPPMGYRSHGSPWAGLPLELDITQYLEHANTQTMVFAQIETKAAMENLRLIAGTRGLDGLFVGPVDLAISHELGLYDDKLWELCTEIVRVAEIYGLPAGTYCSSPEMAEQRIEQGFRLVNVASDVGLLISGARGALEWKP